MSRFVYVVEAQSGFVKIGTSSSPRSRATIIHQSSPVPCRLIAIFPGWRKEELALHKQFAAQRAHCEWFRIEGPVAEFVEQVRGSGCEVETWGGILSPAERIARGRATQAAAMRANWADPAYRARLARMKERREQPPRLSVWRECDYQPAADETVRGA